MSDKFWVGGSGNWSDTAHWSNSSGGSSGAAVPGASDDVTVNSSSGTPTIELDQDIVVHSITTLDVNTFNANGFNVTLHTIDPRNCELNMGDGIWRVVATDGDIGDFNCGNFATIIEPGESTLIFDFSALTVNPDGDEPDMLIGNSSGNSVEFNDIVVKGNNSKNYWLQYDDFDNNNSFECRNVTFQNPPVKFTWKKDTQVFIETLTAKGKKGKLITIGADNSIDGDSDTSQATLELTNPPILQYVRVYNLAAIANEWTPYRVLHGSDGGNTTLFTFSNSNSAQLPSYNPSLLSAIARVRQGLAKPEFIIGGQNDENAYALFRLANEDGDDYFFSLFYGPNYKYNNPFGMEEMRFNIHRGLTDRMELIPILFFDGATRSVQGTPINTENYAVGQTYFKLGAANFGFDVRGRHDIFYGFLSRGADYCAVRVPVYLDVDIDEDP